MNCGPVVAYTATNAYNMPQSTGIRPCPRPEGFYMPKKISLPEPGPDDPPPLAPIRERIAEHASRSAGRPSYEPNDAARQIVCDMAFAGIPHDRIAVCLGISVMTLRKYYEHELETSSSALVSEIAMCLAARARAGSDTAAIFLLKTRGGDAFKEKAQAIEVTGKDGAPLAVEHKSALVDRVLAAAAARRASIPVEE